MTLLSDLKLNEMLRLHRPFRLARSRASRVRHDEARALFLLCATVSFCTLAAHTMVFPRSSSFLKNVYDASAALGVALGALLSSMEPVGLENTPPVVPSAHDGELDHRGRRVKRERGAVYVLCEPCARWRPPRAHHCRTCGRCVRDMDHHCHGLRACIGRGTHGLFLLYLFLQAVATGSLARAGWQAFHEHGGVAVGLAATGFGLCGAAGSLTFAAFGVMALANVTNKELEERSKDDRGPSTSVLEMAARPLQRALARVFGPRSRRAARGR